jgi:RNA polymerase sigma-32 factor
MSLAISPLHIGGSLSSYYNFISGIERIDRDIEYLLAKKVKDSGDIDSAKELILSHLRFVAYIAKGYSGYGLPQEDLIQEGNIGLIKAVGKFDPDVGVRLADFSVYSIRQCILEYVLNNWKLVRIATKKAHRKIFFNLRKNKSDNMWLSNDDALCLAERLGVTKSDIHEMELRMSSQDFSIDPLDDNEHVPQVYLTDKNSDLASKHEEESSSKRDIEGLYLALDHLDERSRDIIQSRWLNEEGNTLRDIGIKYGISLERVRQIENAALKKLRDKASEMMLPYDMG